MLQRQCVAKQRETTRDGCKFAMSRYFGSQSRSSPNKPLSTIESTRKLVFRVLSGAQSGFESLFDQLFGAAGDHVANHFGTLTDG